MATRTPPRILASQQATLSLPPKHFDSTINHKGAAHIIYTPPAAQPGNLLLLHISTSDEVHVLVNTARGISRAGGTHLLQFVVISQVSD